VFSEVWACPQVSDEPRLEAIPVIPSYEHGMPRLSRVDGAPQHRRFGSAVEHAVQRGRREVRKVNERDEGCNRGRFAEESVESGAQRGPDAGLPVGSDDGDHARITLRNQRAGFVGSRPENHDDGRAPCAEQEAHAALEPVSFFR
jgi:hypothetical protein